MLERGTGARVGFEVGTFVGECDGPWLILGEELLVLDWMQL